MLGAGIRLGEALVSREQAEPQNSRDDKEVAARLGLIEDRLKHLEIAPSGPLAGKDAAAFETMRSEMAARDRRVEALGEISISLRSELQTWLEESVAARMTEVESKLRSEAEQSRKNMLDAFAETVQTRVMQRIARLEEEVAGQSAAMNELRECSLRTEQSVQRLLGGIDRLVARQSARPEEPTTDRIAERPESPDATPLDGHSPAKSVSPDESTADASAREESAPGAERPAAPVFVAPARPRRWGIFG